MLPLRAEEEKSSGSHGKTQIALSWLRLTKQINLCVRRSPPDKKWADSTGVAGSDTKSSLFLLDWTICFYFFPLSLKTVVFPVKKKKKKSLYLQECSMVLLLVRTEGNLAGFFCI